MRETYFPASVWTGQAHLQGKFFSSHSRLKSAKVRSRQERGAPSMSFAEPALAAYFAISKSAAVAPATFTGFSALFSFGCQTLTV